MNDIINAIFELSGGWFIFLSVLKLHKDKIVRGVSWIQVAFFASWGFWNIYYYPSLNQWWSFIGGLIIVCVNTIWLFQMVYYIRKEKREAVKTGFFR